jgi:malate/lactate dehydrogenase
MKNVIVVIGAGSIGQATARRVSAGKHVLLADLRQEAAEGAAKVLSDAGFEVSISRSICMAQPSCSKSSAMS